MAVVKGTPVKITYNGADITEHFDLDEVRRKLDSLPAFEFTFTKEEWQSGPTCFDFGMVVVIGPRTASRQSCLWRHSFDWRNRKRGHPVHREG